MRCSSSSPAAIASSSERSGATGTQFRSATALSELCVGDGVRIDHIISPRYLHGLHGTIVDLDEQRATACLHRPVGRFHTGEIRCPSLTLEKLAKAS